MKQSKIIILLSMCLFLISACSKSDNHSDENKLIGIWHGEKEIITTYKNGSVESTRTFTITPPDYFKIHFKLNNNFEIDVNMDDDEEHMSGYYSVSGNKIQLGDTASDPDKDDYTFTLSGNSLIIKNLETEIEGSIKYEYETVTHLVKK